jgi:hypothetical protein
MGEDEKEEDLVQAANVQRQVDFIADNFSLDEEDWEQFLTGLQDADFC